MAKQLITKVTDDLDGGAADETVHFSLDGIGYEIDLSSKHASELRQFLGKYQDAGTRTGRVAYGQHAQVSRYAGAPKAASSTGLDREQNQKIRAWAAANGWELAERGRIPQHVVDSFESKTPNPQWVATQQAAEKVADEVTSAKVAAPRKRAAAPKAEFAGAGN